MSKLDDTGFSNYRRSKEKCPVCGIENTRAYITEGSIGVVEDYYYCDNCGYFDVMAYSRPICGMPENYDKKYQKEVKSLDLEVFSMSDYRAIMSM